MATSLDITLRLSCTCGCWTTVSALFIIAISYFNYFLFCHKTSWKALLRLVIVLLSVTAYLRFTSRPLTWKSIHWHFLKKIYHHTQWPYCDQSHHGHDHLHTTIITIILLVLSKTYRGNSSPWELCHTDSSQVFLLTHYWMVSNSSQNKNYLPP